MNCNFNTTLIELLDNEPRISHRVIATQVELQQKNIVELIRKYSTDFLEFGTLPFKTEGFVNNGKGEQPKTFYLNEQQATLLMTYLRNSEIVRNFKVLLVKEFFKMREILNFKNPTEPDLDQIEKRVKLVSHSKNLFFDFKDVFLEIGISEKNELAITSNRAVKKETGIDFIAISERKGLEAKEKFFTVTELCETVRNSDQFANEFKIQVSTKNGLKPRPQNLNLLLEISEFQFRENGEWKLTEKGEDFGKLSQNKSKYSDKTVYHLVWSKRVLENLK
jgi:phage regulator Rha-like protein